MKPGETPAKKGDKGKQPERKRAPSGRVAVEVEADIEIDSDEDEELPSASKSAPVVSKAKVKPITFADRAVR